MLTVTNIGNARISFTMVPSVATSDLASHCTVFIAIYNISAMITLTNIQLAIALIAGEVTVGIATCALCCSMRRTRKTRRSIAIVTGAYLQTAQSVLLLPCHARFILSGRTVCMIMANTVRILRRCERFPLVRQTLCQRLAFAIPAPPWCLSLPLLRRARRKRRADTI